MSLSFGWPTAAKVPIPSYCKFGARGGRHTGLDFGTYSNPVVASEAGTVRWTGDMLAGGYAVWIQHADGYETRYLHLKPDSIMVGKGQSVGKDQQIAQVGHSGLERASAYADFDENRLRRAAHLHFEIRKGGKYLDPATLLTGAQPSDAVTPVKFSLELPPAGPAPSDKAVWPLGNGTLIVPEREDPWSTSSRSLGAKRPAGATGTRCHAGVDLYAKAGEPVYAIDDGTISRFYPFVTGKSFVVYALIVDHGSYVINYGEVALESKEEWDCPRIKIGKSGRWEDTGKTGSSVKAGQKIAFVGEMRFVTGRKSMLHLEMYTSGTKLHKSWPGFPGGSPPSGLLDPTAFLKILRDRKRSGKATVKEIVIPTSKCR